MDPFKVVEGVYQVGGAEITAPEDCAVYLLDLGAPVLIDAGAGGNPKALVRSLELLGYSPGDLKALVLTHAHIDHAGGASFLVEKYGLPVYAHHLEADVLEEGDERRSAATFYGMPLRPCKVSHRLEGEGGDIPLGFSPLHWIHTPGHTPGSISLWAQAGMHKVLFAQDVHGPFYQAFGSDLDQWEASMRKLLQLEADVLCEGHFGIFRPAGEVRSYIEYYLSSYGRQ
jgi:glyoxylase-like metal-dependent hydrolase (beta-lactamase superfamily II)